MYRWGILPECSFFSVTGVAATASYLSLPHHLSFVLGLSRWVWFSCIWWGSFRRWAWFLYARLAHFCNKYTSSNHYCAAVLVDRCMQLLPRRGETVMCSMGWCPGTSALYTYKIFAQNYIFVSDYWIMAGTEAVQVHKHNLLDSDVGTEWKKIMSYGR